jgi:hypothetical protein
MARLQRDLLRTGQHIPGITVPDEEDLACTARVTATSRLTLSELPPGDDLVSLEVARAMLLPLKAGKVPAIAVWAQADQPTEQEVQLRLCSRPGSYTPDVVVASQRVRLAAQRVAEPALAGGSGAAADAGGDVLVPGHAGEQVTVDFDTSIDEDQYAFVCFMANPEVRLRLSDRRVTGILSLSQQFNRAVAKASRQEAPEDSGIDSFEFWPAARRPGGKNVAVTIRPGLEGFAPGSVCRGPYRPGSSTNAWVADPNDASPALTLSWDQPQTISRIALHLDVDFDHPLESVLMGHPEYVVPFCVRRFRILDDQDGEVAACADNHQGIWSHDLEQPLRTTALKIEVEHPSADVPAALFGVRCYA